MSADPALIPEAPRLFDQASLQRTLIRLGHEIVERHPGLDAVVLIGIRTRGLPLALRLADVLCGLGEQRPPVVAVDPRGFRDDRPRSADAPADPLSAEGGERVPTIAGAVVILIDDVLYTGRTQRAALDAVLSAGRPAVVEMLVLVDRGHRELPLRATYVGKNVPTTSGDRVAVRVREVDGHDGAWLLPGAGA